MEGMGFGFDVVLLVKIEIIFEDKINEEMEDIEDIEEEYEEFEMLYLEFFEREWVERWFSGVVRRV